MYVQLSQRTPVPLCCLIDNSESVFQSSTHYIYRHVLIMEFRFSE
jgi:hypothetical protein